TAREALLDLAAEQAKLDRDSISVADGKVVGPQGRPAFEFGQLTRGQKLMKVVGGGAPTPPPEKWTTAGTSVPKVDGRSIGTGAHQYSSDVRRPGMVFGRVLRAPSFKATMTSVETKDAAALPGVTVVRDGNFVGVTAPTAAAATSALEAIRAEWK